MELDRVCGPPRLIRLARLQARADDTAMALGSDLMTNALEGYAFLKIAGKGEGLDHLRKMMLARFDRNAAKAPAAQCNWSERPHWSVSKQGPAWGPVSFHGLVADRFRPEADVQSFIKSGGTGSARFGNTPAG